MPNVYGPLIGNWTVEQTVVNLLGQNPTPGGTVPLLVYYLAETEIRKFGTLGIWPYFRRRILRIWPLYFAFLALAVALQWIVPGQHVTLRAGVWFSFLAGNWFIVFHGFPSSVIFPLWSVSIEEQFYLIWPLLLVKVGRGVRRQQLIAALMLFGLGCGAFAVIMTGRMLHLGGWHWLPNVKFGGLLVGCLLRIGFSDGEVRKTLTRFVSGRSLALAAALFCYFVVFHSRVTIFDPVICGLAVCATLLEPNSRMGRLLELPALRWIGRLSYSLYIWQQVFLGFGVVYRPFGIFSRFPVNLASTVLVASASYYLLEKPMMRLGQKLSAGRRPVLKAMSARAAA